MPKASSGHASAIGRSGLKFRRQFPLGPYVLDLWCAEARLVVEVDGAHHLEPDQAAHDAERTAWLEARGARVVRFLDTEVLLETDAVVQRIADVLVAPTGPLTPSLSPDAHGIRDHIVGLAAGTSEGGGPIHRASASGVVVLTRTAAFPRAACRARRSSQVSRRCCRRARRGSTSGWVDRSRLLLGSRTVISVIAASSDRTLRAAARSSSGHPIE